MILSENTTDQKQATIFYKGLMGKYFKRAGHTSLLQPLNSSAAAQNSHKQLCKQIWLFSNYILFMKHQNGLALEFTYPQPPIKINEKKNVD